MNRVMIFLEAQMRLKKSIKLLGSIFPHTDIRSQNTTKTSFYLSEVFSVVTFQPRCLSLEE